MSERQHLESAIRALEAQRPALGDAVVDAALRPLRQRLAGAAADPVDDDRALRQVSILFTDVVESTRLAQHLDPEDIQAVMDGALARFRHAVEAHGGRVLQYAGDSMLAAFGTQGGSEAQAEQAVRTGLAILAEAREHAETVRQTHAGLDFAIRVGVHTGTVLLGGGADGENTIRGNAVNVAARMEQGAAAGTLRISQATLALVRGRFEVVEQPPVAVKEHEAPLRSWVVRGLRDPAGADDVRGIEGVATPMVGREAELDALRQAFLELRPGSSALFVTVVGEGGIGKTRLRNEFERWLAAWPEPVDVLHGRARESGGGRPFALLRDIVARHIGLDDTDSMPIAREKIERGVADVIASDPEIDAKTARANAHLLGHLIGIDFAHSPHVAGVRNDARQIRAIGLLAAAQWLRRLAAGAAAPLVLVLDDLHWADDESLDFVGSLASGGRDLRIFVLALARPTLGERRGDWPPSPSGPRIALHALDSGARLLLAESLLQRLDPVPAPLLGLVVERAEGNPYYMEELVKMLVDDGALEVEGARWRFFADRLHPERMPGSLTGVLQARLDRLDAAEKRALQQASVIGAVFWEEALAAIAPGALGCVPALERKGLVVEHASSALDGTREFAFAHQLLHRVTYETILKPARRDCHRQAAIWLAARVASRPGDTLAAVAEHHEKAGDPESAGEYFVRAAEHAAGRYANEAADEFSRRALVLLEGSTAEQAPALRWRAEVARERVAGATGRRDVQRIALDALDALADRSGEEAQRAFVAYRRSEYLMRCGEFTAAERQALKAQALAEAAGDDDLALRARSRLAAALHYLGRSDECIAVARAGIAAARRLGLSAHEALFLNAISVASFQTSVGEGLQAEQRQAEICAQLGNRSGLTTALCNIGASLLIMGDFAAAEPALRDGLKQARDIGDRETQAYPLLNLAQVAWRRGDGAAALAFAEEALGVSRDIGSRLKASGALYWIGNARLLLGQFAEAARSFREAWAIGVELGHSQRFDAAAGLARIALEAGDIGTALEHAEAILAHRAAGGTLSGSDTPALISLTCFRTLDRAGDVRAATTLSQAVEEVRTRAERIEDPQRRICFLAIAEHRDTLEAGAAATAGTP